MASHQNSALVLSERPTIGIVPGQTFRFESTPSPRIEDLKDGDIIVENLYLSMDPAMRAWLDGA